MYHTIEFTTELLLDLEISRKKPLERTRIEAGTRLRAQIKPYVVAGKDGPVEVADLFLEDGTSTSMVPFACFCFVD